MESFEYNAYGGQHEAAARELLTLLNMLDANFGQFGQGFQATPTSPMTGPELDVHVLSRIAAAAMCLFSDPKFQLSPAGITQLLNWHRWLSTLFAASPLRNADAVLRALNILGPDSDQMEVRSSDLVKLCLLFNGDSRVPLNLDALWAADPHLTAGLGLTLLAPRFCGSPDAHHKREIILPWLAERLGQIESLDSLPTGILHDAYMHCSYADRPDKHDIKRGINTLIRRKLKDWNLHALPTPAAPKAGDKPVMLVVLEWFNAAHSIYRTHSRTMEAARERFRVIGTGLSHVDASGRAVFDAFHELPSGGNVEAQLRFICELARQEGVHVLYMPSVGMFPLTMFMANLRVAPLQAYALGHPATTHAPEMDFVVVEEDYVGDPACFSETLLLLPPDGMPYRPSAAAEGLQLGKSIRENPDVVDIAIAATTMKLNPNFLATLARIATECDREVRFHFLVGQAIGLVYEQVVNVVRQYLEEKAVVYRHQSYDAYMRIIAGCDLFLNPFPFGNTNGIIDTVSAGLVGVCRTGREVHEHIDEGLFSRLGMPNWLAAHTTDEYVAAAVRLIRDDAERGELSRNCAGVDKVDVLFKGRPEILGKKLLDRLNERLADLHEKRETELV
ncbi:hypothetical protein [Burkholderia diffusa]|uniref:hypothetical protein n=1 Tax=Burkholderia diffusa TaxID=488732 RepID=UPI0007553A77|nr:hypothetical protein [Burkholderia diffusa]KVM96724.1 peptide transporter [Burkholderia diffusa]